MSESEIDDLKARLNTLNTILTYIYVVGDPVLLLITSCAIVYLTVTHCRKKDESG